MTSDSMKPLERILAILNGQDYDRPAVIAPTSVANVECMELTGAFFPAVHTNDAKMISLAETSFTQLGFDSIAPYFSIQLEAAALECETFWGTRSTMPKVISQSLSDPSEFRIPKGFLDQLPVKTVLSAIRQLKQKYGDKAVIIGKVVGPWTLAYHLYGIQNFLMDLIINPQRASDFLNVLKQIPLLFANAQVEAGADMITWADHATGDLVSRQLYEEFLFPVHKECFAAFKKDCGSSAPLILHTCGYALDRVDLFAQTGIDIFHFDSRNDIDEMLRLTKDKIHLTGCVNNPSVLLNGKPETVKEAVENILNSGIEMVSPECAIPCFVPNSNLKAIPNAVHSYRKNVRR